MIKGSISPYTDVPADVPFNHEYVIYDESGKRIKIICRKCGDTIADVIESVADVNPDTGYITKTTRFQLLINYALVKMLMTNGLVMDSAMCKKCANRTTPHEVQKIYDSELLAIERDGVIHGKEDAVAPVLDELRAHSVLRRIG